MRKLKDLFLISVVLLLVSCSMSAKSDKNETGNVAAQGEVVVLNKADFLTKVYNYEKRNWLPLSAYRASLPYCLFLLKENRNWHREHFQRNSSLNKSTVSCWERNKGTHNKKEDTPHRKCPLFIWH